MLQRISPTSRECSSPAGFLNELYNPFVHVRKSCKNRPHARGLDILLFLFYFLVPTGLQTAHCLCRIRQPSVKEHFKRDSTTACVLLFRSTNAVGTWAHFLPGTHHKVEDEMKNLWDLRQRWEIDYRRRRFPLLAIADETL